MALQKYHPFGIRIRRPNYAFDLRALRDLSVLMIFLFTQIISPLQGFVEFVLRIYNNFIPSGLKAEDQPCLPLGRRVVFSILSRFVF